MALVGASQQIDLDSPVGLSRRTNGAIHPRRIIRAIEAGELRAINASGGELRAHWRVRWADFLSWLESRENTPRRDVAADVEGRVGREEHSQSAAHAGSGPRIGTARSSPPGRSRSDGAE